MSDKISPSKLPKGIPSVQRDATGAIVAGMGIVRKLLFSAPITHDGWQKMMLTHIAAAKALGFTMFEIDASEGDVTRRKKPKQKEEPRGGIFGIYTVSIGGDDWKQDLPEPETTDGPMETIRTTIVRVYALAVE